MSSALVGFFEENLVSVDAGGEVALVFFVVAFAAGLVAAAAAESSLLLVATASLPMVGGADFATKDVDLLGEAAALVVGDFVLVKRFLLEGCLKKDTMEGCAFFFLGFSAVADGVILRQLSSFIVVAVFGGVVASSATTSKAVGMME
jgi:hypothetical protein